MIGYDKIPESKTIRIRLTPRPKEAALSEIRSVLAAAGILRIADDDFRLQTPSPATSARWKRKWDRENWLKADPSVQKGGCIAPAEHPPRPARIRPPQSRQRHAAGRKTVSKSARHSGKRRRAKRGEAREERTVALVGLADVARSPQRGRSIAPPTRPDFNRADHPRRASPGLCRGCRRANRMGTASRSASSA